MQVAPPSRLRTLLFLFGAVCSAPNIHHLFTLSCSLFLFLFPKLSSAPVPRPPIPSPHLHPHAGPPPPYPPAIPLPPPLLSPSPIHTPLPHPYPHTPIPHPYPPSAPPSPTLTTTLINPPLTPPQYAQELLSTFSNALSEVSLQPSIGGIFRVELITATTSPTPSTSPNTVETKTTRLWDRKSDGGFPETKELKRRVRDVIQPGRSLGHVDRTYPRAEAGAEGGATGGTGTGTGVVEGKGGKGGEEGKEGSEDKVDGKKPSEGEVCATAGGGAAGGDGKCEDCE